MATPENLRVALESDDRDQLMRLCALLDRNLTVTAGGYGIFNPAVREMPLAHHLASKSYGLGCLRVLIKRLGPDCLACKDKYGYTAVHMAAYHLDETAMAYVRDTLGRDCLEITGRIQRTAVHCAAMNTQSNSALKWLVRQCGPQCLTVRDANGDTPVHLAAWKQDSNSMELIKSIHGLSCFYLRGHKGRKVIHCAAMNLASNDALKWLVNELGSHSLTVKDSNGDTPVHLAAWKQGADSMDFMRRELGPYCFHQQGQYKRTVYHFAAMNSVSIEALKWLIDQCGPQALAVKDRDGKTPVHLVALRQTGEALQLVADKLGNRDLCITGLSELPEFHRFGRNACSHSSSDIETGVRTQNSKRVHMTPQNRLTASSLVTFDNNLEVKAAPDNATAKRDTDHVRECSGEQMDSTIGFEPSNRVREPNPSPSHSMEMRPTQEAAARRRKSSLSGIYKVTSPQGICLVVNIRKYKTASEFEERLGSELDVSRISILFSKLNFQVEVHENLGCPELAKLLSDVAYSRISTDHGCFVCFIMAHGKRGQIICSDGEALEIQSITDRFRANQCPNLRHKPKGFFFQSCRGVYQDSRKLSLVDGPVDAHSPPDCDFLLCFACSDRYQAFRDEQQGSRFVQVLCQVVDERHRSEDILHMMTKVNQVIKENPIAARGYNLYTASPMESQLSKLWFLDPELAD